MNIEVFGYSVLSAVLGMAIVFTFLWLLSVMMSVIKRSFGEKPQRDDSSSASAQEIRPVRMEAHAAAESDWVIAAVAAFLMEEALDSRRSALAWVHRETRR